MTYTEADVDRLGDRLANADMDPGELRALHALLKFAAHYSTDLSGLEDSGDPSGLKQVLHRILFEPVLA